MNRTLLVVARQPVPGQTKTRLHGFLSAESATELYSCFLLDTLELMQRVAGVACAIAYSPPEAEPYFRRIAPAGFGFLPQVGSHLGERLDNALRAYLDHDGQEAVIMDSDSPTLPVTYLQRAFQTLDDPAVDLVLGPTRDGGYYLIGLKQPCSALFDVTMSTPEVLHDTLERARSRHMRTVCLPQWYDIDTPSDLAYLRSEIGSLPASSARHTRGLLARGPDSSTDHSSRPI